MAPNSGELLFNINFIAGLKSKKLTYLNYCKKKKNQLKRQKLEKSKFFNKFSFFINNERS